MPSDKKISELPVAAVINGADVSVLVDNDIDYQYTFTQLLQFIQANLSVGASLSFGTALPQNTAGNNGDVFINTSAGSIAQKISGTWTIVYTLPAANGADGTLLYGAGSPGTSTGKNTDSYIDTLSGIFYQKNAGAWSQVFSMATGPQGPQGTAGTNGTNGIDGNTILFGTVNPSNSSTGTEGNFYINISSYTMFGPKTSGVWGDGISLIGAGISAAGTTGQVLVKVSDNDYDTDWADASFAILTGQPADNANLSAALTNLQNNITAETTRAEAAETNKVDKAAGYGLSSNDYTTAEKTKLANLSEHFAGVFSSAAALRSAHPAGSDGQYAVVESAGVPGVTYIWDSANNEWVAGGNGSVTSVNSQTGAVSLSTDNIGEGTSNLYFTATRALSVLLSGLSTSSSSAISATDDILTALGKLQAQLTGIALSKALFSDLNAGADDTKYATALSLQNSKYLDQTGAKISAIASGTDTYTASISPAITQYTTMQRFFIQFTNANTVAATLNLNGLGAVPIKKNGLSALQAGDIAAGQILCLAYDGTNFQIINSVPQALPTVTSGEKVLSITSAGPQKNYDLIDQVAAATPLTSADFSSGIAAVTGFQGQVSYDANYRYDCIGTNQWVRQAINNTMVDLYLADIDDSSGDKTSSDLQTAYPSSLAGQQVWGSHNLYIKKTSTLWKKIATADA